jgi:polysaccharide export outer membrane protein
MKILTVFIFILLSADEGFKIMPGDTVILTVFGEESMSGRYEVEEDGTLNIPPVGRIKVAGLSSNEIENYLVNYLKGGYMVEPRIKVEIVPSPLRNVFVLGEVKNPGSYDPRKGRTIIDYILIAGGPTPFSGDTITLLRREGNALKRIGSFSLSELIKTGNTGIDVSAGDIIYVSRKEKGSISSIEGTQQNAFYVVGEVKSPGAYEFKEGFRVLDALLSAGGPTDFSALNKTKVYRYENGNKEVIEVDLEGVIKKGKVEGNIEIKPGDIIYIPGSIF